MKISRLAFISPLLVFATPVLAFAQGINPTYLQGYSSSIIGIINVILVPVLVAIAFITFLWGVYRYFIYGAADETARAEGRQFILWGLIGFVVIMSLWAIVNILTTTLGLGASNAPSAPTFGPGQSTINSGLGNPNATAAQQTQATSAYQACQAKCTGPVNGVSCGDQCQNIYAQAINSQSGSGCADPYASNYNPSSTGYNGCQYGTPSGTGPAGGSGTAPGPNGSCPAGQVYDSDTATCMNSISGGSSSGSTNTGDASSGSFGGGSTPDSQPPI